ncbi:hypothetical protein HPB47_021886 [Ixodes persulcatus]|uniref:Uncharacterized protein n=1 Tax=Ixodes persulcatus TaxID=34615 RepID=A0AC60QBL4_IXOPE|nr:hypothetical protein HPB47_021886 [Ixodes persulcatus]
MTISVDIHLNTDTSSLDLVFPNGIEEGGRVRLNLLRPTTGYATQQADTLKAPIGSAADAPETTTYVLEKVYVPPGVHGCDAESKHPWETKNHSVGQVSSRSESEEANSEAVDALPGSNDSSSCPYSPGTNPKTPQDQECRPKASDTTAIAMGFLLRVEDQEPPPGQGLVLIPVSVDGQHPKDCPNTVASVPVATAFDTALIPEPVAPSNSTPVKLSRNLKQIAAPSAPTSEAIASIVDTAPTKTTVAVPLRGTQVAGGKLPRMSLIPVIHPEVMAEAEKLPQKERETFIAASAKIVFKCLECSHSTFDKDAALKHLAEHTPSQASGAADSQTCKTQQLADQRVLDTLPDPSAQTTLARRSTRKPQCLPHHQLAKVANPFKLCLIQSRCEDSAAAKERVMRKTEVECLECDQCHHFFVSQNTLQKHQLKMHAIKSFACDQCPLVTKSQRSLRQHVSKVHRQTLPFECERCSKRFTTKHKLHRHTAVMHLGDAACLADGQNPFPSLKVYRCQKCPHVTFSLYRSKAHAITHTGVMPFPCSQCDKSFVVLDMLKRHVLLKHDKGKQRPCPHCGRHFISESFYQCHLRLHEMNGGFACDQCGQLFESKAYLERHQHQHKVQEESCTCDLCGKTFKTDRARTNHVHHMHPEAATSPSVAVLRSLHYPHGCDHCPMRFKTPVELHAHQQWRHVDGRNRHVAESKRYECSYCSKGYTYNCELRAHMRRHTGERPFACERCDRTFSKQQTLKNHVVRVHTKAFKIHCLLCKKGCVTNTKLKQHLQTAHKAVTMPTTPAALRRDAASPKKKTTRATHGRQQQQGAVQSQAEQQDRDPNREVAPLMFVEEQVVERGSHGKQVLKQEQVVIMAAEEEDPTRLLNSCF